MVKLKTTLKIEDYLRQVKYLIVLGQEILKEDGVFKEGVFFTKLEEFIASYNEIKPQLLKVTRSQKNNYALFNPSDLEISLKFRNYQAPALPIFALMVIFPIFVIGYFFLKNLYVKKTKNNLRQLVQSLSSLGFIVENGE